VVVRKRPADLQAHNCIRYRLPGGVFIPWIFVVDGKTVEFDVEGSIVVTNDPGLVIDAALQGVGVAYLYEEYVASLVADGRLVSLLDKAVLPVTDGFFLFYPSRRQNSAALRALIDFLRSDRRTNAKVTKSDNANGHTLETPPFRRAVSL
jgi:DNA-binding transcriptional LysR family regulator